MARSCSNLGFSNIFRHKLTAYTFVRPVVRMKLRNRRTETTNLLFGAGSICLCPIPCPRYISHECLFLAAVTGRLNLAQNSKDLDRLPPCPSCRNCAPFLHNLPLCVVRAGLARENGRYFLPRLASPLSSPQPSGPAWGLSARLRENRRTTRLRAIRTTINMNEVRVRHEYASLAS